MRKEYIESMTSFNDTLAHIAMMIPDDRETDVYPDCKCIVEFSGTMKSKEFENYYAAINWLYRNGFIF